MIGQVNRHVKPDAGGSKQPSRMRSSCFLTLLLFLCLLCRSGATGKSASVSLAAKWQATPFLLETAEFLVCFPLGTAWTTALNTGQGAM